MNCTAFMCKLNIFSWKNFEYKYYDFASKIVFCADVSTKENDKNGTRM